VIGAFVGEFWWGDDGVHVMSWLIQSDALEEGEALNSTVN
jgi:hypothetical protein